MDVKGIDEIPMFSWNTKTKEFSVLGHKFDGVNSVEDFINYINNLDKENKHLKELQRNMDKQYTELENNWNLVKRMIKRLCYSTEDIPLSDVLDFMEEIESDNNDINV